MLATGTLAHTLEQEEMSAPQRLLPAELDFYLAYNWCLDPHPTVREAIDHLRAEIDRLKIVPEGWQTGEVSTNVFLLSCAVSNAVEEYLRGPTLRMPRQLVATRLGRGARWATDKLEDIVRYRRRPQVRRWGERWQACLDGFLSVVVAGQAADPASFVEAGSKLAETLRSLLPPDLQAEHIGVPTPFRRLDLTHFDVLALGQNFIRRFPDRSQAILLLGLRTSGSYFAPLLRTFLKAEGYQTVSSLTVQPNKGLGRWERQQLERSAERGYSALILDDPPYTGGTIALAFEMAQRVGFAAGKLKVLAPTHPAKRNWSSSFPNNVVVSLEPEQWHKRRLLEPAAVESRLKEYFRERGLTNIRVVASSRAEELNARLRSASYDERRARLKQIFEVRVETPRGCEETRYVLAKSVGWGWLGYHAFLVGHRLSRFVPPILGLRNGILYTEWFPQPSCAQDEKEKRVERIETCASYVAARVGSLRIGRTRAVGRGLQRHQNGLRLLAEVLSKAYGRLVMDTLMRPRLQQRLCKQPCPCPVLIDGKMERSEWIVGPDRLLKTDYEHHGMGKSELNVLDPTYDLANAILDLALSPEEESTLIQRYVQESGDASVAQRLFMNKLLAGVWAMDQARQLLFNSPKLADRQQELHQRFMSAWNFLTVHAARFCGSHCRHPQKLRWRSPLVALDIDGVLDRRVFGFPCTTAAAIEALSLLNTHEFSVSVNTARSALEVKAYCQAYCLAGGVAEYGSYLWDAVAQRERVLISPEPMRQLNELRRTLRQLPGVFLDDRHQYSIRAFTYQDKARGLIRSLVSSMRSSSIGDGALAPLPTLTIQQMMVDLGLDRLRFHQTMIDTTIVAKDVDKGTGLLALRDWVLASDAETVAVGDSESDLPMFRAATRSFAPAHIGCARQARLLGCQISRHPFQRGLLDIARSLVHPHGQRGEPCAEVAATLQDSRALFLELLQAADQPWAKNLIGAFLDPAAFRIFMR
jgi:hydroxymethylpyrimidine pyrophosphatase-like HAD family hydrolase